MVRHPEGNVFARVRIGLRLETLLEDTQLLGRVACIPTDFVHTLRRNQLTRQRSGDDVCFSGEDLIAPDVIVVVMAVDDVSHGTVGQLRGCDAQVFGSRWSEKRIEDQRAIPKVDNPGVTGRGSRVRRDGDVEAIGESIKPEVFRTWKATAFGNWTLPPFSS